MSVSERDGVCVCERAQERTNYIYICTQHTFIHTYIHAYIHACIHAGLWSRVYGVGLGRFRSV
jgi:hypothetical protein